MQLPLHSHPSQHISPFLPAAATPPCVANPPAKQDKAWSALGMKAPREQPITSGNDVSDSDLPVIACSSHSVITDPRVEAGGAVLLRPDPLWALKIPLHCL